MKKQKLVIKMQMKCDKCRTKSLQIAAVANGVTSVALEGEGKDRVVVTGEGIDAAVLTQRLKKKVGYATILSLGEADGDKKKEDNAPAANPVPIPYSYNYQFPTFQVFDPQPRFCGMF